MIQGLLLSDLADKWRERLAASAQVNEFGRTKFGKKPQIFIGINPTTPPGSAACPYIVILPQCKREGVDWKQYRYWVLVQWAVVNAAKTETTEGPALSVLYDCDQLGRLILNEIAQANPAYPLSHVKYQLPTGENNAFPLFAGSMELKIDVVPVRREKVSFLSNRL
jgi:hypothetical protein